MNAAGVAVVVDGDVVAVVVGVEMLDRTYPGSVHFEGTGYLCPVDHPSAECSFSGPVVVTNFAVDGRMVSAAGTLLL